MTEQSSTEFEKSVAVIMAKITKLIQVLTVNHKEQMEEQARQLREQVKKHAEQMAVMIGQIKTRNADM